MRLPVAAKAALQAPLAPMQPFGYLAPSVADSDELE
jgi:hypothetical protein